jgi:hypothetical protein
MKVHAELFRDVNMNGVRIPEIVHVEIEFPEHVKELSPGFFKDHTNGGWQVVKVGSAAE